MKYALLMWSMSAGLFAGGIVYPSAAIVWIWAGLSFSLVGCGYAGLGHKVFGKNEKGTLAIPNKIALFPFLVYSWGIWHVYRQLNREEAFNRVCEDLVIGRRLLSKELPEDIDWVIDLTAEFDEATGLRNHPGYRSFPILDAEVPSLNDLRQFLDSLPDGKIYLHCAQGHGRTGVVALCLLFHLGRIERLEEGLEKLRSVRPGLGLNRKQLSFVVEFLAAR